MEELAAEIRVALPSITDHHMTRLMRDLTDKGVHSKEDMFKVGAVDLVNALGTEKAKKLVAYFNAKRELFGPNNAEVRTHELAGALATCEQLNEKLDADHAKRREGYDETAHYVKENMQRLRETHDATLEQIKRAQAEAYQAHEDMLQNRRRPDTPVETHVPSQRERGEETQQIAERLQDQDCCGGLQRRGSTMSTRVRQLLTFIMCCSKRRDSYSQL